MKHSAALKQEAVISTQEIQNLLVLREAYKALKEKMDLMERSVNEIEDKIIGEVELGLKPDSNLFQLNVSQTVRRYPKWKEHFVAFAGPVQAENILEATPPTISKKLLIG